jgi:hypothetical protein
MFSSAAETKIRPAGGNDSRCGFGAALRNRPDFDGRRRVRHAGILEKVADFSPFSPNFSVFAILEQI